MGEHHHHHHHRVEGDGRRRRLGAVFVLTATYMGAEVVGGFVSSSLALLADAGHMFSDAAALALALVASWLSARPADPKRTYGFARTEVLAALANGVALMVTSGVVLREAVGRLSAPPEVEAPIAMAVAAGGLLMNVIAMFILHGDASAGVNERGAYLHVLSDALGSIGALVAGGLIWTLGWTWADPVASLLIAVLILRSAWGLLGDTVRVLMEAAPAHIDVDEVRHHLRELPQVAEVHDLHIWAITPDQVCLSAHVVAPRVAHDGLLERVQRKLREDFAIEHATIQLEDETQHADVCRTNCQPGAATT